MITCLLAYARLLLFCCVLFCGVVLFACFVFLCVWFCVFVCLQMYAGLERDPRMRNTW